MKTGNGQSIEVPMFETMVAFVMPEHLAGLTFDPATGPSGYSRVINPWRRPYATADGYITVLPYTTAQWQRFFGLIGREDLASDPDLADPLKRNTRVQDLYAMIADAMPARTTKAWVTALLEADILFGEVLSPEDLIVDPHLLATGLFTMVDHPSEGRIRLMNPPVHSSTDPARLRRLPPGLGQHSREILCELGVSDAHIDELGRAGHVLLPIATAVTGSACTS
jgi:crotonobetainyl-CoA:carnitine CoA-transferase CaiB-like acyl-CoA transferase